jgi:hypothetical protein
MAIHHKGAMMRTDARTVRVFPVALAAMLALGAIAGCAGDPAPQVSTTRDFGAEPVPEEAAVELMGTRDDPLRFGASATILDIGEVDEEGEVEGGGDGWSVTINQPIDVTAAIVDKAMADYGGNEDYVYASRPRDGMMWLGVPGTVQRLQDAPLTPSSAMTVQIVTSEGTTLDPAAQHHPEVGRLMDSLEMYAPASYDFMEVFEVPIGTTGDVLVTGRDSYQRFFWGLPKHELSDSGSRAPRL